eukprot:3636096-Rhodomonas_salina.1
MLRRIIAYFSTVYCVGAYAIADSQVSTAAAVAAYAYYHTVHQYHTVLRVGPYAYAVPSSLRIGPQGSSSILRVGP